MDLSAVNAVYFSPTKTTEKIIRAIAQEVHAEKISYFDCTNIKQREKRLPLFEKDLLIIGSPVYEGRLPHETEDFFTTLRGKNAPVVNVVVYGGRAYEDSLLELQNITIKAGFTPLACAAFIGEHSFSSPKTPIASMRPDSEDIATAREFGMLIREKLKNVGSLAELEALKIPGKWPYRKRLVDKIKIAPAVDRKRCNLCGMCLNACPNGAIYRTNHILTDKRRCLLCCACVKICPHHAKVAKNLLVALYSRILSFKCRTRKLPALFL